MTSEIDHPFEDIENAHGYIELLIETIDEVIQEVQEDLASASYDERLQDAMRIVLLKLSRLSSNMHNSSRILNDLRTLRRVLLAERPNKGLVRAEQVENSARRQ